MVLVKSTIVQLLSLLGVVVTVGGFSSGPPSISDTRSAPGALRNITYGELVCSHLTPGHFTDLPQSQAGNGGFVVNATELIDVLDGRYTPGESYRVDLVGTADQFRGFILQARDTRTGNLIGSFTPLDNGKSHVLNCGSSFTNSQATVSHKSSAPVSQQSFLWQSPRQQSNPPSTVSFIYSVVKMFPHYWIRLNASEHRPSPNAYSAHFSEPQIPEDSGNTLLPCPTSPVHNTTFRVTSSLPHGCQGSECSFFVGINTNQDDERFLDFLVEGRAQAWVAVGFTTTPNMFDADVLGCNRYSSSGRVVAIDTWNPSPPRRTNILDSNQNDICQHSSSYEDGRIQCTFSRRIVGGNREQDVNLDGKYYFLMGTGDTQATSRSQGFTYHQRIPSISATTVNPAQYAGAVENTQLRKALTKTHGVLMIVAWPVLAGTAVLFAAFLKPVLKEGKWFQVHRAIMLTSLLVGVCAFILIFIAHKDSTPAGLIVLTKPSNLAHFIIGTAVMILHITNPCVALFRCKPNGKYRWIYNILHGKLIGYSTLLLALVNIAIGITLMLGVHSSAFGLHMVSSGYSVALFIVISIFLKCIPWLLAKKEAEGNKALLSPNQDSDSDEEGQEKKPGDQAQAKGKKKNDQPGDSIAEDSKFRWSSVVLYLIVTIPLMITVIILIAVHEHHS